MRVERITKGFCNSYLLLDKGVGLLIDTLYPQNGEFVIEKIKEVTRESYKIKAIFITHAHIDHAGSAAFLSDFFNIPVIAHRFAVPYLMKGENSPINPYGVKGNIVYIGSRIVRGSSRFPGISPDIVFDGKVLNLNEFGINGYILHTPGHTPDSSSLIVDEDAIIGDLLMGIPFPQVPSYPLFMTDISLLKKSISDIFRTGAKRFYPGHGYPWTFEKIRRFMGKLKFGEEEMALIN